MAKSVIFHIGLPKSGTTYLQTTLWSHADRLRQRGVLLPGDGHREHRWGSLEVREDPRIRHRHERATGSWDRLTAAVADWDGTAVITHEFYCGASRDQARRALDALAPAEVHLVLTARDPLRTLTSAWQEMVKYGNTTPIEEFSVDVSDSPARIWNWRALDVAEVLDRWGGLVPPDRVHVLPVPRRDSSRQLLWERFGGLVVDDPEALPAPDVRINASIGLVECEVMRRVGAHLTDLAALPRSTWVRKYLAETRLANGSRERFSPGAARVEECRDRARRAVRDIERGGYHVVGSLEDLLVPDDLPALREPSDVTEAEVAARLAEVVAEMLTDLRGRAAQSNAVGRRVRRLERDLAHLTAASQRRSLTLRRALGAARRWRNR